MTRTQLVALLATAFVLTHLGLCLARVRTPLVERLGLATYRALYSALSLVLYLPMAWLYLRHPDPGPWLWELPHQPPLTTATLLLSALAMIMVVAALQRPSPASVVAGPAEPRGIQLVTRHPLMMGLALLSAAHLPLAGSLSGVCFFGSNLVVALVGAWHQDQRKRAEGEPEMLAFLERTSFLPLAGSERLQGLREVPLGVVVGGVVLALLLLRLHGG